MEGVITAGFAVSSLPPLLIGCQQAHTSLGKHMVHCRQEEGSMFNQVPKPGPGVPLLSLRGIWFHILETRVGV